MSDEATPPIAPAIDDKKWGAIQGGLAGRSAMSEVDLSIRCVFAGLTHNGQVVTGDMEAMDDVPPYLVLRWNLSSDQIAIGERHALAALCLYEQPFGFTQEDVAVLRAEIALLRLNQRFLTGDQSPLPAVAHLESLLARIAALLPPPS